MTQTIELVEIDVPYCSLTYGSAPCTAQVGVTGADKCYNTRNYSSDCQDKNNFTPQTKTYRFKRPSSGNNHYHHYIASISAIKLSPARIKPGESIGERMTAQITFKNHRYGDSETDKYYQERGYIATDQGTLRGKFRARNPYMKGSPIRIYRGELGQRIQDMNVTHLIIEDFVGPSVNGDFTLKCVDMFKFLDDKKAQAPTLSNGFIAADITPTSTSVSLLPVGIGAEYPASGLAAIGKELVTYTRSGDTVTLTRGARSTIAEEHQVNDTFQRALEYQGQTASTIIHDLITNYTDLDATAINQADWDQEMEAFGNTTYTAIIPKPTGIKTLLDEIVSNAALIMYPDVRNNQVVLRGLRPISLSSKRIDDDVILDSTLSIKDNQNRRVDTAYTFFNQKNYFDKTDDEGNYFSGIVTFGNESDQYQTSAIKKTFSRWISSASRAAGAKLNQTLISRFEIPPRTFALSLDAKTPIALGEGILLSSKYIESANGEAESIPAQVISLLESDAMTSVVAEEMRFTNPPDASSGGIVEESITIAFDGFSLNLRALYDSQQNTLADINDVDFLTFYIPSTTKIGSLNANTPAVTLGDWPGGVDIAIINQGLISGKGGKGVLFDTQGGIALKAERPVTIDNTDGKIWGGGGGGHPPPGLGAVGGEGAGLLPPGRVRVPDDPTEELGGKSTSTIVPDVYKGGDAGQQGFPQTATNGGGQAGAAISGVSFVTIAVAGNIRGPQV